MTSRNVISVLLAAALLSAPLLAAAFLPGCSLSYSGDQVFWLESRGALLPVWIRGNRGADWVVVNVHGGPGSTCMTHPYGAACARLERTSVQVYYDQRGSGASRGNPADSSFTLEQFVADLDLVLDAARALYPGKRLAISGGSWGGTLVTAYAVDPGRQGKLDAWILEDGPFDDALCDSMSQAWIMERARERIAAGEEAAYWIQALAWLEARPHAMENFWPEDNKDRLNEYLNKSDAYIYAPESDNSPSSGMEMSLCSPMNIFSWLGVMNKAGRLLAQNSPRIDLGSALPGIRIPTLIIWGVHDGRVPFPMARMAYDAISTDPARKRLVPFEASAHSPASEEPVKYVETVLDFLGSL
jgi:proline iminopeptidase